MALQFLKRQPTNVIACVFLLVWGAMFMLLAALQPMLIPFLTGDPNMDTKLFFSEGLTTYPNAYMVLNLISTGCMFFLPAVLFSVIIAEKPLDYLRLNKKTSVAQFLLVTVGVFAIFPLITGLGALIQRIDLGQAADVMETKRNAAMNNYITQGSLLDLIKNLTLVALIPAIFEELFFRGVIQKLTYSVTQKAIVSFLLTSLVFTIFHASVYQFLPIFIGSMMLCWLYYITGNMKLNIWLHFLNNGIQIVILYLSGATETNADANNMSTIMLYVFIGLVVSFILYKQLKKYATPLPKDWHFNPYININTKEK